MAWTRAGFDSRWVHFSHNMSDKFESLYVTLIDQIERTPNGFAVFDFDNTCIINDITEATLHYIARNNLFRDKNLLGNEF